MKAIFQNKSYIHQILCLVAVLAVGFTGIRNRDLWTPDEPRVAAITLEMAENNNFIIPYLSGEPFIEKPPLYFVTATLMLKLIGPLTGHTAAIRLTTAIFGLGVLLMTFLIARRLWGKHTGILAVAILSTMGGFVQNFHWIRVDAALAFFVTAAVWCFVEFYFEDRKTALPWAGFFLAGAFLSKGFIGPVLAAVPFAGLTAIWHFSHHDQKRRRRKIITSFLRMLLVFIIISGTWIILLYFKGGPTLWKKWFWVNHVGRFMGNVSHGHIKPGEPFYYVFRLITYGLPWTPLFLYWLGAITIDAVKKQGAAFKDKNLFLYIWAVGSVVLLTIPATKRGVYLLPVLPVFAIISAVGLRELTSKCFTWYEIFWTAVCLLLIAVITVFPLVPIPLLAKIPDEARAVLVDFNYYHAVAGFWLAVGLIAIIWFRKIITMEYIMVLTTTGLLVTLLGLPLQAIDQKKSMAEDIRKFVAQVPESQRPRIAGTGFSETIQGAFYYYTGWRIPQIRDKNRVTTILCGKDIEFDSLIVNDRDRHGDLRPESDLAFVPYRILAKTATGTNQERKVFWIEGLRNNSIKRERFQ